MSDARLGPPDADIYTNRYHELNRGACGPCALAAVLGVSVAQVLTWWPERTGRAYDGHARSGEMVAFMQQSGFEVRQIPGRLYCYDWPFTDMREGERRLVRIQWDNPDSLDGSWTCWQESIGATHWVALRTLATGPELYCNSVNEWRRLEEEPGYLTEGKVTSVLVLTPSAGAIRQMQPVRLAQAQARLPLE